MNDKLKITQYCLIRHNKVISNGNEVFVSQGVSPQEFMKAYYHELGTAYPKYYKMDNMSRLGFLAVETLLKGRDLNMDYGADRTALVLSNSSSSLDTDRAFQASINDRDNYFPSPSVFVYTLPNLAIGEICIRHKFYGENIFFVNEVFDTSMICNYVTGLFNHCVADCCIAGWLEADMPVYEAFFCLIEKHNAFNNGISIFEPDSLRKIYSANK